MPMVPTWRQHRRAPTTYAMHPSRREGRADLTVKLPPTLRAALINLKNRDAALGIEMPSLLSRATR